MNTISHEDLLQLVEAPGDQFVSVYMPTYAMGREIPQNPIRFREVLETASSFLHDKGTRQSDIEDFLAPALQLLERPVFWKALGHGLAVLLSTEEMRVWQLPSECEELCVVGKRFHITPLIAWLNEDAAYYVLTVSQNRVRLLHGTRYKLRDVNVPNLPSSLAAALHYDPREGLYQTHSGELHFHGKEGLVFTGQGGEADVAKEEMAAFFQTIDMAVSDFLHARAEPLIFAGVDYLFPIYRQHNHYAHLLPAHISGNPDLLPSQDLREHAWPLLETSLRLRQETAIAKYWNLVEHSRVSNHVAEIITAAHAGVVETLFIGPAVRRLGAFDPQTNVVRLDDRLRNDSEDLVNLAAGLVLKHRGTVETLASGNIPGGGSMAAVFRYAPAMVPAKT